jgi:hypothetical protein
MFDVIKRVVSCSTGFTQPIFEPMDTDANHTKTIVPRLDDFMIDPLPLGCRRADQNNGAGPALHLSCDPLLYL